MPDFFYKSGCLDHLLQLTQRMLQFIKTGVLFVLFSSQTFGQETSHDTYLVEGRVIVSSGAFDNVKARCILDQTTEELSIDEHGAFVVRLLWNSDYLFDFQKPGCITKSIRFSTHIPQTTDKSSIQPFLLMVKLNPVMKDVDTAYFRNPVGFVRFRKEIKDFEPVTDYDLLVKYNSKFNKKQVVNTSTGSEKGGGTVRVKESKFRKPNMTLDPSLVGDSEFESKPLLVSPVKKVVAPYMQFSLDESFYPQGITTDTFRLARQTIYRYILKFGRKKSVFLEVIHDWGPTFYFISDSPDFYRCISQQSFKSRLYKNK